MNTETLKTLKQLEVEASLMEERADLVRHVANGGRIEYAYTELIGNYAGEPARWWPLPIDLSLGAAHVASSINGFVSDDPVIYRAVQPPLVRYAVVDSEGLIGSTTSNEELALRWLKSSTVKGARIVKMVEVDY